MKKIEKLTAEQVALMPVVRDEWLGIGLSTAPTDRAEAERGVREAYGAAGRKPPKIFIWLKSPMAGALGHAYLEALKKEAARRGDSVGASVWDSVWASVRDSVGDSVWASVGDSVWASVGDSVGDSVWDSVWASVWASVRDSVGDSVGASVWDSVGASVWDSVGASVWDSVWASVRDSVGDSVRDSVRDSVGASVRDSVRDSVGASVRDSVRDSVGDSVRDSVNRAIYGQHEAGWLSFYWFFQRACGLKAPEKLGGIMRVARSAGWWWPFEGAVILTERPTSLLRDDRGRLHCEDGPAISYSDGWSIWSIHGVRTTQKVVEHPETLTIDEIRKEPNAEVKRIMRERFGEGRYLSETKARVIDVDSVATEHGPDARDVVRALIEDDEGRRFLVGSDGSTQRCYHMEVPASASSCSKAHSFLAGFDERRIRAQS